jgi:hypothetical protein
MSKSRQKSSSEVQHLRGEVRRLKAELKYYKRRSHIETAIIDDVIDGAPLEDMKPSDACPECGKGVLIEHDFKYVVIRKCTNCEFKVKK